MAGRKKDPAPPLSRREREIMDALYRLREATATEIADALPDEDSFDSIRVTLGNLKNKGHVKQRREGQRNVYTPAVPHGRAKRSALKHVLHTFFEGSPSKAILTLIDQKKLSEDELDEIATLLERHRPKRRKDPR